MNKSTPIAGDFKEPEFLRAVDREDINPRARLLLNVLAYYADTQGCVSGVSAITLAEETGMLQQSVSTSLKRLQRRGFLTIHRPSWPGTPNRYVLHVPGGDQ